MPEPSPLSWNPSTYFPPDAFAQIHRFRFRRLGVHSYLPGSAPSLRLIIPGLGQSGFPPVTRMNPVLWAGPLRHTAHGSAIFRYLPEYFFPERIGCGSSISVRVPLIYRPILPVPLARIRKTANLTGSRNMEKSNVPSRRLEAGPTARPPDACSASIWDASPTPAPPPRIYHIGSAVASAPHPTDSTHRHWFPHCP